MLVIDEILWLLRDGEWYDLQEITEKVKLPRFKMEIAVNFLREYDFVQLDEKVRRIKLQTSIIKFIDAIQRLEKEEALTH